MNIDNKKTFDKIDNEIIIRLEELELRKKFGTITINLRMFNGKITKDIDINFKETIKFDK